MLIGRKMINCDKNEKWVLPRKNKKMTYIVAGNLNNTNFLMVDAISSSGEGENLIETFSEKMFQLNSEEHLYTTLTGDNIIMNFLLEYDRWITFSGEINSYTKKETLELVINKMLNSDYLNYLDNFQLSEKTTLYFISQKTNTLFYYEIEFTHLNKLKSVSEPKYIDNDTFVICCGNPQRYDELTPDFLDFYNLFKIAIIDHNKELNNQFPNKIKILSFKNRFSYIDNNKWELRRPYKTFDDYIKTCTRKSFGDVDDVDDLK